MTEIDPITQKKHTEWELNCYGAFFLVNYLAGESIKTCMSRAAEAAAFVVAHAEAIPVNQTGLEPMSLSTTNFRAFLRDSV